MSGTAGAGLLAAWAGTLVVTLVLGLLVGWLLARRALRGLAEIAAERVRSELGGELATLRERTRQLEQSREQLVAQDQALKLERDRLRDELDLARDEKAQFSERAVRVPQLEADLHKLREEADVLRGQVVQLQTQLDAERSGAQEKLAVLSKAEDALRDQFKTLATDILEEKSKRFAEQNQTSLAQLLDPLRLRIQEFQGRVEKYYDTEGKERSALAQQVIQLMQLNKTLADEAKSLTSALKGSSKTQGNWGELVLERVLEGSGLRKGVEYEVQESFNREEGTRAQPDVIIRLPEGRHLVIDAKVSLLAYEAFCACEEEGLRGEARRRHLESIRAHIKGLSERNYQTLYGLNSLDFVLMFVPIEPAFIVAVTEDGQLFMDAWNRNVLLVSPSTLLFVVRTVAHLWRQEAQSRNANDIARRGAELYDRLTSFVVDLERVGKNLKQAQDAYGDAFDKLTRNKGNVIRQAEMLKQLGVKPTKSLPQPLVELAGDDDGAAAA